MSLQGSSGRLAREDHASADDLSLFVIDALAGPARQRLEGHVAACADCAAALAAEARAEQTLQALWPAVSGQVPVSVPASVPVSVQRPLAEVVALPRPAAPLVAPVSPPAPKVASARASYQGSLGGLAAAVVTVLFVGWWTDAGRLMTARPMDPGRLGAPLAACLLSGGQASGDDSGVRICAPAPPSLAGMASWGMCAPGAPAGTGGVCRSLPDLVCAPDTE